MKKYVSLGLVLGLLGCNATMPKIGDGSAKTVATGAAAGGTSQGANDKIAHCAEPLGTVAMVEDQSATWYRSMQQHELGSTLPVLRLMVQQSNCFVVVERGRAMQNMNQERALAQSGEIRAGSAFGKGQMVAADYTMNPSVTFSAKGTSGVGGALAGVVGGVFGALAAGMKTNDASTVLMLIDNRSGVQISVAEGSARNTDFSAGFGSWFGAWGSAKGYTDTPQGKVVVAAFVDSYNQMVKALQNYQAQEVKGGLGKGGRLKVGN